MVQCKGVEDQAAMKEAVESQSSLVYPELIVRSDTEPAMRTLRDQVPMVSKDVLDRSFLER